MATRTSATTIAPRAPTSCAVSPHRCHIRYASPPPIALPPPRDYFLYAGRIERAKGVLEMIEAYLDYCRRCPEPLPLHVAGRVSDEAYRQQIDSLLATSAQGGNVHLLGECLDIGQRMRGALAVIVPSPAEAFGRCMPEAMWHGTLVVCRDAAGSHEQLENGLRLTHHEIALRYQTGDQLTEHLLRLTLRPQPDDDAMRQRAQQTVAKLYSSEANADAVMQLYTAIMGPNQ